MNNDIKILFVSSGNSHYGIIPFIKNQGEALKDRGIGVDFFTIQGKGVRGYIKNIRRVKKKITAGNYDLIHAHYGLSGFMCVLAFSKLPIILSLMGSDVYGSFNAFGKRKKSSYLIMILTQITLLFVERIVVKSKNILEMIPQNEKCHLIPNGVDFSIFKPGKNRYKNNLVLFLGNPKDPRKNFNLVKNAFKLIDQENLKLVNPYPIPHYQFPDYLNSALVFVLCSYNEGSPNVIKEAMACNCPIVSTNVGDIKWIFGNTAGCYLTSFEPEDVAEKIKLAVKYAKLQGNTNGRDRLIKLGLDSHSVADQLIKIYQNILFNNS